LNGIWAGVPLAWDEHDCLDESRYAADIDRCLQVGAAGVYAAGSTGEFYALDFDEFRQMTDVMTAVAHTRAAPCQIGCTWLNTRDTIRRVEYAAQRGAAGVQLAVPFWMPMAKRDVLQFFADVAGACPDVSLIIYNTARSKHPLGPDEFLDILEVAPTLVGQKYGGSDIARFEDFCRRVPDVCHFSGEPILAPAMLVGGRGAYSSFIYACPDLLNALYAHCLAHEWDAAMRLQRRLNTFVSEAIVPLIAHGYIDPQIDKLLGHVSGVLSGGIVTRRPYSTVSSADVEWLRRLVDERFPEFTGT
jgi:4-hydroxy-tetrahydrodipicolinate synthase